MVEADLNLAKREKAMLDAGLQENTVGGVKAKSRKRKVEIKKQKLKFGKLKAEIAGFELAVFLHFSFQLSTFNISSVAGGADPGFHDWPPGHALQTTDTIPNICTPELLLSTP